MPFADRKTWEKERPREVKDTGIGDACDLWKKSCKDLKDIDDIAPDKAKTSAALIAIDKMLKALANATGKMAKVKDAKKKTALDKLLKDWGRDANVYQNTLNAAVTKAVRDAASDEQQLTIDKTKVVNAFFTLFKVTQDKLDDELPRWLDEAEASMKKNDQVKAEAKLQDVQFQLKQAQKLLKDPMTSVKVEEKRVGLPEGTIKLKEIAVRINPYKAKCQSLMKRLEKAVADVEEMGDPKDPTPANTDKAYAARYDKVLKAYKVMLAKIQKMPEKMQAVFNTCQSVNGNTLLTKDPVGMTKVIEKRIQEIEAVVKESAGILADIRNGDGSVVKIRDAAKLDKEDNLTFGPLTTRAITINAKTGRMGIAAKEQLEEAVQTIIETGKTEALAKANQLLTELWS